jgi:hypothetical protein
MPNLVAIHDLVTKGRKSFPYYFLVREWPIDFRGVEAALDPG